MAYLLSFYGFSKEVIFKDHPAGLMWSKWIYMQSFNYQ